MADSIKVSIRARPLVQREKDLRCEQFWNVTETQIATKDGSGRPYMFDRVFSPATYTEDVYLEMAKPIVESAMNGFNGTIFAYGQTGSGKTFTMSGNKQCPGIIPRVFEDIFNTVENTPAREFLIRVSYLEIYNENVVDLLGAPNNRKNLDVREDMEGCIFVKDLTEVVCNSSKVLLQHMKHGDLGRHTGQTNMNERSSRSHSIFRLVIESRERSEDQEDNGLAVMVSQLNLVDLAGAEKAKQTGASGQRLVEGASINKSLTMLGLVISQLSEGASHVSYRDSKLTRILQNSLGGNSRTVIICNVTLASLDETQSTLRFATNAKRIKNQPVQNEVLSDQALLRRYRQEITLLTQKLEQSKQGETGPHNQVLLNKLAEKEQLEQEHRDKIEKLTQLICVSSQCSSALIAKKKAKRRQTWCPGKARMSLAPIAQHGQLGDSTLRNKMMDMSTLSEVSPDDTMMSQKFDLQNSDIILPDDYIHTPLESLPPANPFEQETCDSSTQTDEGLEPNHTLHGKLVGEDNASQTEQVVGEENASQTEQVVGDDNASQTEQVVVEENASQTEQVVGDDNATQTELLIGEDNASQTEQVIGDDNATQTEQVIGDDNATQTELLTGDDNATQTELLIGDDNATQTEQVVSKDCDTQTAALLEEDKPIMTSSCVQCEMCSQQEVALLARIDELEDQLAMLQNSTAPAVQTTHEVTHLPRRSSIYQTEITELERKLASSSEVQSEFVQLSDVLSECIAEKETLCDSLQIKLTSLEDVYAEKITQFAILEESRDNLSMLLDKKEIQVIYLKSQLTTLQKEYEEAQELLEQQEFVRHETDLINASILEKQSHKHSAESLNSNEDSTAQLNQTIDQLKASLQSVKEERDQIQRDLDDLLSMRSKTMVDNAHLQEKENLMSVVESLEKQLSCLQEKHQLLINESEDAVLYKTISQLQAELQRVTDERNLIQNDLDEFLSKRSHKTVNEAFKQEKADLLLLITSLKEEITRLQDENEQVFEKSKAEVLEHTLMITDLKASLESITDARDQTQQELNEVRSQLSSQTPVDKMDQQEKEDLISLIEALEEQMKRLQEEHKRLKESYNEQVSYAVEAQNELLEAQENLYEAKQQVEKMRHSSLALTPRKAAHCDSSLLEALEDSATDYQFLLAAAEERNMELSEQVTELQASLHSAEEKAAVPMSSGEDVNLCNSEITRLQDELCRLQSKQEGMCEAFVLQELQKDYDQLQVMTDSCMEQIEEQTGEIQRLTDELQVQRSKQPEMCDTSSVEELQRQYDELKVRSESYREQCEAREEDVKLCSLEITRLKDGLSSLHKKLANEASSQPQLQKAYDQLKLTAASQLEQCKDQAVLIEELNSEILSLTDELQVQRSKQPEMCDTSRVEELQREYDDLKVRSESYREQCEAREEDVKLCSLEITQLKDEMSVLQGKQAVMCEASSLQQLQTDNEELKVMADRCLQQIEEQTGEIQRLTDELQVQRSKQQEMCDMSRVEELQREYDELKVRSESYREQCEAREEDVKLCSLEITQLKDEMSVLQGKQAVMCEASSLQQLQTDNEELKVRSEIYREQCEAREEDVKLCSLEITQLKDEVTQLERKLEEMCELSSLQELQRGNDELKVRSESYREQCEAREEEVKLCSLEITRLQDELSTLLEKQAEMCAPSSLQELQREYDELKLKHLEECNDQEAKIKGLNIEIQTLTVEIQTLQSKQQGMCDISSVQELQQQFDELEVKADSYRTQCQVHQEEVARFTGELGQKEAEISDLKDQIGLLQEMCEASSLEELQKEYDGLKVISDNARKQCNRQSVELTEKEKLIQNLRDDVTAIHRTSIQGDSARLQELQEKYDNLQKEKLKNEKFLRECCDAHASDEQKAVNQYWEEAEARKLDKKKFEDELRKHMAEINKLQDGLVSAQSHQGGGQDLKELQKRYDDLEKEKLKNEKFLRECCDAHASDEQKAVDQYWEEAEARKLDKKKFEDELRKYMAEINKLQDDLVSAQTHQGGGQGLKELQKRYDDLQKEKLKNEKFLRECCDAHASDEQKAVDQYWEEAEARKLDKKKFEEEVVKLKSEVKTLRAKLSEPSKPTEEGNASEQIEELKKKEVAYRRNIYTLEYQINAAAEKSEKTIKAYERDVEYLNEKNKQLKNQIRKLQNNTPEDSMMVLSDEAKKQPRVFPAQTGEGPQDDGLGVTGSYAKYVLEVEKKRLTSENQMLTEKCRKLRDALTAEQTNHAQTKEQRAKLESELVRSRGKQRAVEERLTMKELSNSPAKELPKSTVQFGLATGVDTESPQYYRHKASTRYFTSPDKGTDTDSEKAQCAQQ